MGVGVGDHDELVVHGSPVMRVLTLSLTLSLILALTQSLTFTLALTW